MEQTPASRRQVDEVKAKLGDPIWRLDNLYYITDTGGRRVRFRLNWAQRRLLRDMWFLNVILKARQLGMTTFIQIFILDRCLFNSNVRAGVIAHNKEDALVFFRDKIKFAYDNLPEWLKAERRAIKNDAGELLLSNNSSIRVGTSMRSGTLQYLHVSEYGKICRKYPEKAQEIRTGALNAVHAGHFVFVESTAEGRAGEFYELCQRSRKLLEAGKAPTKMDYKFHFFAWWQDQRYRIDPAGVVFEAKHIDYFAKLKAKHGITLDTEQMAWYVKKAEEQGEEMKQEFPSTPDEAFEVAIEGAFYGTQMTYLRSKGRLREVPWEPALPVNTFWDLGMNDSMTIWFHQRVGLENRLIDYYQNSGEGIQHYARVLRDRGYLYGTHYMPHDISVRELGNNGLSRKEAAENLGIKPIEKVPRPKNLEEVLDGIESVRAFLMTCWIDEQNCADGIRSLDNYQKEWDDNAGTWKKGPLHNWASHGSDALRTGATGFTTHQVVSEAELYPEVA
jgi:hypothetical protein